MRQMRHTALLQVALAIVWLVVPEARLVHSRGFNEVQRDIQRYLRSTRPNTEHLERSCNAASDDVQQLRRQVWPRQDAGPAPRITRLLYLNMDESKDRRKNMETQLTALSSKSSANISVERFRGRTAEEVKKEPRFAAWRERGFSKIEFPSLNNHWGTAANMLGKYEALKFIAGGPAANDTTQVAMLLEDDVTIDPDFEKKWEAVWPYVPKDFDILRVGGFHFAQTNCSQAVNAHVDRAVWFDPPPTKPGAGGGPCQYCGSQAYIVRPNGLSRVLRRIEASKMMLADMAYNADTPPLEDGTAMPPLRIYFVNPLLVWEEAKFMSVRDEEDTKSQSR